MQFDKMIRKKKRSGQPLLVSELIKELQGGLEQFGDLPVICCTLDDPREIVGAFRSGDGQICIQYEHH